MRTMRLRKACVPHWSRGIGKKEKKEIVGSVGKFSCFVDCKKKQKNCFIYILFLMKRMY